MAQEKVLVTAVRGGFTKGFLWGAGLSLAAVALSPAVRKSLRPLLVGAMRGAMDLGDEVRAQAAVIRENLSDIVAEAEHEHKTRSEARQGATPAAEADVGGVERTN